MGRKYWREAKCEDCNDAASLGKARSSTASIGYTKRTSSRSESPPSLPLVHIAIESFRLMNRFGLRISITLSALDDQIIIVIISYGWTREIKNRLVGGSTVACTGKDRHTTEATASQRFLHVNDWLATQPSLFLTSRQPQ